MSHWKNLKHPKIPAPLFAVIGPRVEEISQIHTHLTSCLLAVLDFGLKEGDQILEVSDDRVYTLL